MTVRGLKVKRFELIFFIYILQNPRLFTKSENDSLTMVQNTVTLLKLMIQRQVIVIRCVSTVIHELSSDLENQEILVKQQK